MILSSKQVAERTKVMLEKYRNGEWKTFKTPWNTWNNVYFDGWPWGYIVCMAARSGAGKTTILNELESAIWKYNKGEKIELLTNSFEMRPETLFTKTISRVVKKTSRDIVLGNYTDDEQKKIYKVIDALSTHPRSFNVTATTPKLLEDQISKFIKLKKIVENDVALVITLDHALMMEQDIGKSERGTLVDLMKMANRVRQKYPKVIFIILTQLNREIEESERIKNNKLHYPCKKDVFGSDAIWQYADVMIVPHRPEQLGIAEYGPSKLPTRNIIYVHHLKTRESKEKITRMIENLEFNTVKEIQ